MTPGGPAAARHVTVHLRKPRRDETIVFEGVLLADGPEHLLVHARWDRDALDLGYMVFEPGDHFYEHYYTARWYNVFEVRSAAGVLKGWYCNVTRPAEVEGDLITSEDLELDLYVSPDRQRLLRLDEDEFEALGLDERDPAAHAAALAALGELERLARTGRPPFTGAVPP